jgi:hypothetical protein
LLNKFYFYLGFQCNPLQQFGKPTTLLNTSGTKASCTVTSNSLSSNGNQEKGTVMAAMDIDPNYAVKDSLNDSTRTASPDPFEGDERSRFSIDFGTVSPTNNNQNIDYSKFLTQQEYQDFLYAQKLQQTFDTEVTSVDRGEGSYQLRKRSTTVKGVSKKKNNSQRNRTLTHNSATQPTLREAFRRAANKYSQ